MDELHILKYEGYRVRDFFVALEYFFSISEGAPGFYEYWYGDVEEYPGHKQELIDYYRGLDLQKLYDRACVVFEDFDDDYYCMHHFQVVATLAYLENKERVFPYEDCEEEVERCSIHFLIEILARSPIYPEEELSSPEDSFANPLIQFITDKNIGEAGYLLDLMLSLIHI